MVHAFGTHSKDRLRRIHQPNTRPDGCNPQPSWRLGPWADQFHNKIVLYGSAKKLNNAANRPANAANGLALPHIAERYSYA